MHKNSSILFHANDSRHNSGADYRAKVHNLSFTVMPCHTGEGLIFDQKFCG